MSKRYINVLLTLFSICKKLLQILYDHKYEALTSSITTPNTSSSISRDARYRDTMLFVLGIGTTASEIVTMTNQKAQYYRGMI